MNFDHLREADIYPPGDEGSTMLVSPGGFIAPIYGYRLYDVFSEPTIASLLPSLQARLGPIDYTRRVPYVQRRRTWFEGKFREAGRRIRLAAKMLAVEEYDPWDD